MRAKTPLIALSALALGAGAGLSAAAAKISGPQRPDLGYFLTPFEVGVEATDVRFTAADGTTIVGWWMDRPEATQVVVIGHGHRGSKSDMLGLGPGLWREGFAVLLIDFRGNGESGDGPQSLAHYEQQDMQAAVDWVVQQRPDCEVDVIGFSMGAAVSLLVAAADERVGKVVADSPFADMTGVVAYAAEHLRLPAVPLVGLVDRITHLRYGYRFGDVQPIDVVDRIDPRPTLIIHGTEDHVIPVEHSRRLAAKLPSATLDIVQGVDHCGAYFADRPGYIRRVADFLRG